MSSSIPAVDLPGLKNLLGEARVQKGVDDIWGMVGGIFEKAQKELPAQHAMPRRELSFHEHVKLLGYLCLLMGEIPGDIVEIGVWKGKSLCFMSQICGRKRRIFGIDPMELEKQPDELGYYHGKLFPEATLIRGYSELVADRLYAEAPRTVLLHIDGGHAGRNVLLDFLLYAPSVVAGGFVVFDDYGDHRYSPEVGPAVDLLRVGGYFNDFHVLGIVPGYENSYLLQRK
ncbi:class I SAM-dependent methyltransferase [Rhodanobacter sp. C06]|uniref:class I SAM-dependent methyltransferase n=1 Tax=Rhodanobacter sp. C06 TaxID=1945854 RepID=UPI000987A52B|nr:class I SAM-dependent methyltransferase [Rhodanobacter sp. C06]